MKSIAVGFLFLIVASFSVMAAPTIRVSTENSENHPQTQALRDFVELANQRLNGELKLELFPTGKLFRGSDVVNAVSAGRMEIAVPGIWHLSKFVPDLNLFLLPRFYGVDAEANYQIRDGEIGQLLNKQIEASLNVKLLGRWIDLGYAHVFTSSKEVVSTDDLKGLKIRVAGGKGNEARINKMGAQAITIPWLDFPDFLERGAVDGTLTTAATINSVKLWEKGIKYAYLDKQYFPQYVPLISGSLWARLTKEQQDILLKSWDDIVDHSRKRATEFQDNALKELIKNKVKVTRPSNAELEATRKTLMEIEPELIKALRINIQLPEE